MLRTSIVGMCMLATVGYLAEPAVARVSVNIGINLGAPPQLAPVPGTVVMYAPAVPENYFYYDRQYYVFLNGAWYVGESYRGPWFSIAPEYVPVPILRVPVRFYHRPPPPWRKWHREAAPRWEGRWGRRWKAPPRGPHGEHREEHHEQRPQKHNGGHGTARGHEGHGHHD